MKTLNKVRLTDGSEEAMHTYSELCTSLKDAVNMLYNMSNLQNPPDTTISALLKALKKAKSNINGMDKYIQKYIQQFDFVKKQNIIRNSMNNFEYLKKLLDLFDFSVLITRSSGKFILDNIFVLEQTPSDRQPLLQENYTEIWTAYIISFENNYPKEPDWETETIISSGTGFEMACKLLLKNLFLYKMYQVDDNIFKSNLLNFPEEG